MQFVCRAVVEECAASDVGLVRCLMMVLDAYSDDVHFLDGHLNRNAFIFRIPLRFPVIHVSQLFNPPFVHSVEFTPDGRYLAAGLGDSGVVVFDAKTRNAVRRFDGHSAPVCQVRGRVKSAILVSWAVTYKLTWVMQQKSSTTLPQTSPFGQYTHKCYHLGRVGKPFTFGRRHNRSAWS